MKKWIVGLVIILALGGGYYFFFAKSATPTTITQTAQVGTGSLRNVVKATGKIYPIQSSTMNFAKQGTVSNVYKKIGDAVKAGELIAEEDAKSANLDIANAKVSLSNAENNYQKLIDGATETDKVRANNTLIDSKASLALQEKNYENLLVEQKNTIAAAETNITSLEAKLAIAKTDLEYTQKNLSTDTTENNLERDIANDYTIIDGVYQSLPDTIKTIKDTILIEDMSNPKYGDLGAKDSGTKTAVESAYQSLITQKAELDTLMPSIVAGKTSVDTVLSGLQTIKDILDATNSTISLAISEQRASTEGAYMTSAGITSTISSLQSLSSTITGKLSSVNNALASLKGYGTDAVQALSDKNTIAQKTLALDSATNDLTTAKTNLDATKKSYDTKVLQAKQNLTSAQNNVTLSSLSYGDTVKGPTQTDIVGAKNSIQSAQLSLEKAQLALKDYQIIAPFDGIIRDIPWTAGSTAISTDVVSVENTSAYEIEISLDQIDIVKVKEGMPVNITLDAFANTTLTGTVSSISPTPTVSSNVVSYTAKILLAPVDKPLFSEMSATVEVIIAEKNNVIVIPASATRSIRGKTFVQAQTGNGPNAPTENREVTLGLTDSGKVEVLSGLTVGERIVTGTSSITRTFSGSGSYSGTSRAATRSVFGGIGGGAGGGGGRPPGG